MMHDLEKYGFTEAQVTSLLEAIEREFPEDLMDEFDFPETSWENARPISSFNWSGEPDSHGRV